MCINNTYHFYSPSPCTLIWRFLLEFCKVLEDSGASIVLYIIDGSVCTGKTWHLPFMIFISFLVKSLQSIWSISAISVLNFPLSKSGIANEDCNFLLSLQSFLSLNSNLMHSSYAVGFIGFWRALWCAFPLAHSLLFILHYQFLSKTNWKKNLKRNREVRCHC